MIAGPSPRKNSMNTDEGTLGKQDIHVFIIIIIIILTQNSLRNKSNNSQEMLQNMAQITPE